MGGRGGGGEGSGRRGIRMNHGSAAPSTGFDFVTGQWRRKMPDYVGGRCKCTPRSWIRNGELSRTKIAKTCHNSRSGFFGNAKEAARACLGGQRRSLARPVELVVLFAGAISAPGAEPVGAPVAVVDHPHGNHAPPGGCVGGFLAGAFNLPFPIRPGGEVVSPAGEEVSWRSVAGGARPRPRRP